MIDTGFLQEHILSQRDETLLNEAREFGKQYFTEEAIRSWYQEGGIPDSVMQAYRDSNLGYLGLDDRFGGPDVSWTAQMAILEELTRNAGAAIPMQSQMLCFNVVSRFANEHQGRFLVDLYKETARPGFSIAFADDETGSDFRSYKTAVYKKDGTYYIRGRKAFVNNGMFIPYVLVIAKNMVEYDDIETAPFSIWLVPMDSSGVTAYPINTLGQHIMPTAAIEFDDVQVDPEWQIGNALLIRQNMYALMNLVRCVVGAGSLGMAQAALEDSIAYAKHHEIRNRPLVKFQQIAEMITDMQIDVSNMRSLLYEATIAIDKKSPDTALSVAIMKKYVPAAAVRVADCGIQIFGGVGYTDATRLSRIWVDCRANQLASGTDQVMAIVGAKEIAARYIS